MHNNGNYVASLSEMVRWLGKKAEDLGVQILTGFPAASLLVEGDKVMEFEPPPLVSTDWGNLDKDTCLPPTSPLELRCSLRELEGL